jgi:outer membrane lipoprotein carrier protein
VALALLAGGETAPEQVAMDALQKRYDGYRDLRARFVQTSTSAAFPEEPGVAKGTVLVQRPGRIRWNYDDGRVFVLDGNEVRHYDPKEQQVQIASLEEGGVSPTALSFLMGGARLRDDFSAKLALAQAGAEPAGLGLQLVPRGEPSFESLVLWLDPKTYELRESVLVDLFGNRTRLALSDAVYNAGLEPDAFRLEVPEGTEEIDLRTKKN